MMWVSLAFAEEPADPGRWLEHERRGKVEAWWQAQTEESRAWLAAEGRQEAIVAWLAWERQHEANPLLLLDHQDGVSLWSRTEYVPPDPTPRWLQHLYVQGPGEAWPGTEIPLDPTLDRCVILLLDGTRTVLGTRAPWTPDDDDRPCTLTIGDLDGTRRELGTFDQPSVLPSPDGASLLVSHRRSAHRSSLSTLELATGETDELFRTRRALTPVAWREQEGVLATSTWRTGGNRSRSLWLLRGSPDDLDWVGSGPFRPWFGQVAGVSAVRGDEILVRTNFFGDGANLVRVDPERPRYWAWHVLTGERPGMDLTHARVHGDTLLTVWARDGLETLEEAPYDGGPGQVIDLGGPATWISIRRANTPTALVAIGTPVGLHYELRSLDGTYTLLREVPTEDATFRSVEVQSADGTSIPVSVIVPNGPPPPGGRPVLLEVYGGFGKSPRAGIGALERCWLAAGGALGTVHARGGHERGDAWHEAALTTAHGKTYEDLIAAARGLVDQGIAGPGRVAVLGSSNGGLTVAAAVARDPAAFGAAVAHAGVYDLVNARRFGRWWPKEYGRPRDAEQLAVLQAESPVHRQPAGPLPPFWLHTGERDPIVAPAHSFKLAAAWAEAPGGPVLLDVDPWGSHGGSVKVERDLKERAELDWTFRSDESAAETLGFLFAVFDLDVPPITL